jgi:hypothetical protein
MRRPRDQMGPIKKGREKSEAKYIFPFKVVYIIKYEFIP